MNQVQHHDGADHDVRDVAVVILLDREWML
jgi:hypothetical protein